MTEDEAEKLCIALAQANALLNQSAAFVQDHDNKEHWDDYRHEVGKVMGAIYLDLAKPLYERFPNLLPDFLGGEYKYDSNIFEPKFYWPEDEDT